MQNATPSCNLLHFQDNFTTTLPAFFYLLCKSCHLCSLQHTIHNSKNLAMTQGPKNRRVDRGTMAHTYYGILLSFQKRLTHALQQHEWIWRVSYWVKSSRKRGIVKAWSLSYVWYKEAEQGNNQWTKAVESESLQMWSYHAGVRWLG